MLDKCRPGTECEPGCGEGDHRMENARGSFSSWVGFIIRGEAPPTAEGLLQAGKHVRRKRLGFACGDVSRQQGVQAANGTARQPAADGVAVDARQAGHLVPAWPRLWCYLIMADPPC
jgi:hypothetical protein